MQVQALMRHVALCTRLTPDRYCQSNRSTWVFTEDEGQLSISESLQWRLQTGKPQGNVNQLQSERDEGSTLILWHHNMIIYFFWHVSNTSSPKAACLICLPTLPTTTTSGPPPHVIMGRGKSLPALEAEMVIVSNWPLTSCQLAFDEACISTGPAWHPFGQSGQVLFKQVSSARVLFSAFSVSLCLSHGWRSGVVWALIQTAGLFKSCKVPKKKKKKRKKRKEKKRRCMKCLII